MLEYISIKCILTGWDCHNHKNLIIDNKDYNYDYTTIYFNRLELPH
jgi:hypothetical protein